jgi:hypothetical protein
MTVYDVVCESSFNICSRCAGPLRERGVLYLGQGASIALNFSLPPVFGLQSLKKASLVLYKIPGYCHQGCAHGRYLALPLLDYYSVYGCAFAPPKVDTALNTPFSDDPDRCVLEADVTAIVQGWLNGAPENRGLLLTGWEDACRVACASGRYEVPGMRPVLRLFTEDVLLCQPLSAQDCGVTAQL